jgi:hypothetical protein
MKTAMPFWIAAATLAVAASSAQAAGRVDVDYVKPQEFSDAGRSVVDRERTMSSLTTYLRQLANRLPDGQTLKVEVTDIDLAGELYPGGRHDDLRVVRGGADWPRIALRYTLLDGNRTLKSGQAQLSDPAYMFTLRGSAQFWGEQAYEKRMLKQWFDKQIVAANP